MTDTIEGWGGIIRMMRRGVYSHLLLSIALLGCFYPLLVIQHWGMLIWTISLWVVLLSALRVCAQRRADLSLARALFAGVLLLGAASVVIDWTEASWSETQQNVVIGAPMFGLHIALFLVVGRVILFDVLSAGQVTADRIFGAVCFYVLIGLTWAYAYSLVEVLSPGAVIMVHGESVQLTLHGGQVLFAYVYFSFVTLTTLGYGDIIPVSGITRVLAVAEALIGPLYLTILIARLVGQHLAQLVTPGTDSKERRD